MPPTYGPIDAAYAQRMLDEWWTPEAFADVARAQPARRSPSDGRSSAGHRRRLAKPTRLPHVAGDREVMWKLYVHPDHQGAGLGSRLLADDRALVEGDELWLEVVDGNDAASDFYRAHGFEEVERVPTTQWPDDVWLTEDLRR